VKARAIGDITTLVKYRKRVEFEWPVFLDVHSELVCVCWLFCVRLLNPFEIASIGRGCELGVDFCSVLLVSLPAYMVSCLS